MTSPCTNTFKADRALLNYMHKSNDVTRMMEKIIPYLNRDAQIVILLAKYVLSQTKTCLLMKQEVNAGLVPVNNYPLLPKPNVILFIPELA
jgi:hypothetical protein